MKEIKGRFWNGKQMIYWDLKNVVNQGAVEFYVDNKPQYTEEQMLFTGLKDKNGKEIYEGDILDWEAATQRQAVEWKDGGYRLNCDGIYENLFQSRANRFMEIIGNIYQHKALLEKNVNQKGK